MRFILCLAAAAALGQTIEVTETAGIARQNEPVLVRVGDDLEPIFVTVGPLETRKFAIADLRTKDRLTVTGAEGAGFKVRNRYFVADLTARKTQAGVEDSAAIRALEYLPAGVTLLRTQNRMHWAPSFQRPGARGYSSHATWSPVQRVERIEAGGWLRLRRRGHHAQYPEIELDNHYDFFEHVPYFLFHGVMDVRTAMRMFWLRDQEMTMDDFFTHVAWPVTGQVAGRPEHRMVTFDERKPILDASPIPVSTPWVAFANPARGYGFGAVILTQKATKTVEAITSINDGADKGKYWDRRLINQKETALEPGDRFEEHTAYVLFRSSPDKPMEEFLNWERKLRSPLRIRVLPSR